MLSDDPWKSKMWQLLGMKAVILYPALTTPAIVDEEGVLRVLLALEQESFNELKLSKKSDKEYTPQTPLALFEILKFHANLLLVPWGNGHSDGYMLWEDEKVCTRFYDGINNFSYTLFGDQNLCTEAFRRSQSSNDDRGEPFVRGVYLGELPKEGGPVNVEIGGERICLGIIAASAAKMYTDEKAGYKHLFYLEFKNFLALKNADRENGTMRELVWLYAPKPPEHPDHQYENPSDTVMVENFAKNINPFDPIKAPVPFLEKNVDTKPQQILKTMNGTPEELDLYRLRYSGAGVEEDELDSSWNKERAKLKAPPGVDLKGIPWLTQKGGWLFYSRHPVFLKNKITKFAAMSDLHLSSRQTLYKMVKAQVIPGASEKDSPHIGKMAHDNFSSVRDLMKQLCKGADALLIAGDIYDHRQNLDPRVCLEEGKLTNTASLWNLLDFEKYQEKEEEPRYYPKHIDGLMMMELILDLYASEDAKPVFFVAGNHEGYQLPYGISPRLGKEWVKLNEGIPADHNLSIYEAVLLYGPSYHKYTTSTNFDYTVMDWLYQTFTPWSDFYLSQKDFNLVGLGWGIDEAFRMQAAETLRRITLPTACEALTPWQRNLVEHAAENAGHKKNILLSHFTYINFNGDVPFRKKIQSKDNQDRYEYHTDTLVFSSKTSHVPVKKACNTGTFERNQEALLGLRELNKIHYSISGHSHRAGMYVFDQRNQPQITITKEHNTEFKERTFTVGAWPMSTRRDILLDGGYLPRRSMSIALVCGSAGPMASQNMEDELLGRGMDSPQGLILDLGKKNAGGTWESARVDFVRWKNSKPTSKPRFSVFMANLCHFKRLHPFARRQQIYERLSTKKDRRGDPIKEKQAFDYHIRIKANDKGEIKDVEFYMRDNLCNVFQYDWPVTRIKLIALQKDQPQNFLSTSFGFSLREKQEFSFEKRFPMEGISVLHDDFIKAYTETGKAGAYEFVFFVSLFFKPVGNDRLVSLIGKYYETETPWCMPATVEKIEEVNEYLVTLDYRELPDLRSMGKISPEFKTKRAK